MLMIMKKLEKKIDFLKQLMTRGRFPNEKNRIWTMCQASLQMLMMTVIEAEKSNMVNEQFYIEFEIAVSQLSTKDHNKDDIGDFKESLDKFMADSE